MSSKIEAVLGMHPEPNSLLVRYTLLKTEPFFDPRYDAWRESIWYPKSLAEFPQRARTHNIVTSDQLLGVLIESLFEEDKATNIYDQLKESNYYDNRDGFWRWGYLDNDMAPGLSSTKPAYTQQIGALAEGLRDRDLGLASFRRLRSSDFYDPEDNSWFDVSNGQRLTPKDSHAKLGGLILGLIFDRESAIKRWAEMLESGELASGLDSQQPTYSHNELLRILATGLLDRERGVSELERLKSTKLYDSLNERWFRWEGTDVCNSGDQLLGILVESLFEKK